MGAEVVNKNKGCVFNAPYAGRDLYITMYQDNEREFVVTHNANIKPVAYFTGRETELQELRQRIEAGRKSVLVSGMGGIGKTHICRKLFEEYLDKYANSEDIPFCHIGYIEYAGDMSGSLMNCLKYRQQDSPEQNQEAAWRELEYLAADGKLLLFVDNVNVPIREDAGLGRLKQIPGAVVLTSRQTSLSDEFEPYRIGFLDMEQCVEIYEKIRFEASGRKINPGELGDLEYIIENLTERHTITVEFLAHLAHTKLWETKRLREELEQKGFRLEFHKDGELVNIQESYEKLYDLSELTEAEQNILEAFSVFPYIPLEAEICNEWLLADAGVDENDDILMGLYEKGWLQFDIEQESYALHPAFEQFIYEKCQPVMEKHTGLIEACQRSLEIPEGGTDLVNEQYILFAKKILVKLNMRKSRLQADFLYGLGSLLWYVAEHKEAKQIFEKCTKIYQDILGEEHLDTANAYDGLAREYFIHGKYTKAEELYKRCLQIKEKMLGEEHLDTAVTYNNLADLYSHQKKYKEAEELYKKSLQIREKLLGEEHKYTMENYCDLADIYGYQQKYQEQEKMYIKSVRNREKVSGQMNVLIARSQRNLLALMYTRQGRYEEAEELYIKNLQNTEKMSEWLWDTGQVEYMGLSLIYERQGEFKKALSYLFISYTISSCSKKKPLAESAIYIKMAELFTKWNPVGNFEQWLEEQMKESDPK